MSLRSIRVTLSGAPRINFGADGPEISLDARTGTLLAILVLVGPTSRAHAAQTLWSDRTRRQAHGNLRKLLSRARQKLGTDLIVEHGLLTLGATVRSDVEELAEQVLRQPSFGAGVMLAGVRADAPEFEDLLADLRQRYAALRRKALDAAIAAHEEANDLSNAILAARAMVSAEPLSEEAARRLMRLLHHSGDRGAALLAFAELRARLAADTGLPPVPETESLARHIETSAALAVAAPPALPIALERPPRLVGRDEVWHDLVARWRSGATVVLIGEAGQGKTRLAQELSALDQGALRVRGQCNAMGEPLGLLARLLREGLRRFGTPVAGVPLPVASAAELARLLPELGRAPEAPFEIARFRLALDDAFGLWRCAGLTGVILDDLHFADAASTSMLLAVADTAPERRRLSWLLCARPQALPAPLDAAIATNSTAYYVLRLAPLDVVAIDGLLESLDLFIAQQRLWAEALHRHTGGNPLFVIETLRMLLTRDPSALATEPSGLPFPSLVSELIARRLSLLGTTAQELLQIAAIAGPDFSPAMAASIMGTSALALASAWRELASAQIVDQNGVAHDLWHDVATGQVPQAIRVELHRQVAAWLEAHGVGTTDRIAGHWDAGAAPARAAPQWRHAARNASRLSLHAEAVRLYERSTRAFEQAGTPDLAFDTVHETITPALMANGPEAGQVLVARLERDAVTDEQQLRALMSRSQLEVFNGRAAACIAAADQARLLAKSLGRTDEFVEASITYAQGLALLGKPREALATLDGVHENFDTGTTKRRQYDYYAARAYVLNALQRRREAIEAFEYARALAEALDDRSEQITVLSNLAVQYGYRGAALRAAELTETARRIQKQIGAVHGVPAVNDLNLAGHWFSLGRYADTLELLAAVVENFAANGAHMWRAAAESMLAALWLRLGEHERARRMLSPLSDDIPLLVRASRVLVEYRVRAALGFIDVSSLDDMASRVHGDEGLEIIATRIALQLARIESAQEGLQSCRDAFARAATCDYLPGVGLARIIEAECLMRQDRAVEASDAARAALGMLATVQHHEFDHAECSLVAARCLGAAGDRPAARAVLQVAAQRLQQAAERHVPRQYRSSFLQRNRTHAELLALARRSPH